MNWFAVLGIALANNLDNTGVGIALGIARIRISYLINLWIAAITFAVTGLASAAGDHLAHYLALTLAHALSAAILCAMGLWMLLPALSRRRHEQNPSHSGGPVSLNGLLADPAKADWNGSRDLDLREATFLGFALCLNNVGGGVGAGLVHLSVLWTALSSAIISFLVLWLGGSAGHQLGVARLGRHAQTVAGALLLVIGLWQVHH